MLGQDYEPITSTVYSLCTICGFIRIIDKSVTTFIFRYLQWVKCYTIIVYYLRSRLIHIVLYVLSNIWAGYLEERYTVGIRNVILCYRSSN